MHRLSEAARLHSGGAKRPTLIANIKCTAFEIRKIGTDTVTGKHFTCRMESTVIVCSMCWPLSEPRWTFTTHFQNPGELTEGKSTSKRCSRQRYKAPARVTIPGGTVAPPAPQLHDARGSLRMERRSAPRPVCGCHSSGSPGRGC